MSGVAVLREPLLQGRSTFTHDVLYWCFPISHCLADSLLQQHTARAAGASRVAGSLPVELS